MHKWITKALSLGLLLGVGSVAAPAMAQDSGIANTAEDFQSAESSDGFFGSDLNIWDIYHRAGALNGVGVADEGFYRSQSRQINRQAESLRERQRAILEAQAAEEAAVEADLVE